MDLSWYPYAALALVLVGMKAQKSPRGRVALAVGYALLAGAALVVEDDVVLRVLLAAGLAGIAAAGGYDLARLRLGKRGPAGEPESVTTP